MLFKPFFLCFEFWGQSDWMWHCRVDRSQCVFCAVMSLYCLGQCWWVLLQFVLFFFFSPVFSCEYWLASYGLFSKKKKKGETKQFFTELKDAYQSPPPFGFSGPFGNNRFLQPRCACFGLVPFSMFVFFFFFFICMGNVVTHYYFYILERFQNCLMIFACLFLRKKACFLTDMIFCNTSILKYRKENDIF